VRFPSAVSSRAKFVGDDFARCDYRRTDFFADLDFAAGFLAAVFLAPVFFAEVFLPVSDRTALPTGTLVTCRAADFAAATASAGTAGLPCPTRLPIRAPARPPTIAPAGPAIMLPATAPVTPPAACLVSGTLGLGFDAFAMQAVYMSICRCSGQPILPDRRVARTTLAS